MDEKKYYEWKDIASITAMFLIMVAHMGSNNPGQIRPFIRVFANPIFFFLAGLFVKDKSDLTFLDEIKKDVKRLLIPYAGWAILNVAWYVLLKNWGGGEALRLLLKFIVCDRTDIDFGGTAWFLNGLFFCRIVYDLIRRVCRSKYITCVVCICISLFICIVIGSRNETVIDSGYISALFWMSFYSLGSICFSAVNKIHDGIFSWKQKQKLIFGIVYFVITAYAIVIFFKGVDIVLPESNKYIYQVCKQLVIPFVLTIWLIITTFFLPKCKSLVVLGRNTLILCGTESIVKSLAYFMNMIGFSVGISGGLACIEWVFFLCIIEYKWIIPFVNRYAPWLNGKYNSKEASCIIQI